VRLAVDLLKRVEEVLVRDRDLLAAPVPVGVRLDRVRDAGLVRRRRRDEILRPHALVVLDERAANSLDATHVVGPKLVAAGKGGVEAVDVVLGTFAHAWLNGAAADSAPFAEVVRCVVAVAVAATKSTAAAAPAMSITLLCIDSLRIELRRELCTSAAPARSYARAEGVPFRL